MTLQKFINSYEKFLKLILFVMMVALAVTVLLGVSFRFAGSALVWYDEVAAVQLAWITYYGSAYASLKGAHISVPRSEERRVGKECRSRWSPYH